MTSQETYPEFFVIGAPKTGTTSMYDYLAQNKHVYVPAKKELHYFTREHLRENSGGPGDDHRLRTIVESESEYLRHYEDRTLEQSLAVEISPSYLYYDDTAEVLLDASPNARVLAILRDPVERAYSQFLHQRRAQRETLEFEAALDAEPERIERRFAEMWRYTDANQYTRSLETYARVFGRNRLMVIHSEHLRSDLQTTMANVFDFAGVPPIEIAEQSERNAGGEARSKTVARLLGQPNPLKVALKRILPQNARRRIWLKTVELNTAPKSPMPVAARARLQEVFAPEAARLETFLGSPVPWRWHEARSSS